MTVESCDRPGQEIGLRPANPEDLSDMVRLVDFMGEGPALQFWRGQALPIERAWQGQGRSGPPPLATSWRSAVIAEMEGEIAGLAVIAPLVGQETAARRLPGLVRPLQELENLVPGSLCIHVLSVYPAYRHRSIARTLLGHVLDKSGGRDVSAICAAGNFPAIALLAGSGFQPRAVRPSDAGDYMLYLRAPGRRLNREAAPGQPKGNWDMVNALNRRGFRALRREGWG